MRLYIHHRCTRTVVVLRGRPRASKGNRYKMENLGVSLVDLIPSLYITSKRVGW